MWFKNIQFKLVNLSKCGRRQRKRKRKREKKKREEKGRLYNLCLSWQKKKKKKKKEGNVREKEKEKERLTFCLLVMFWRGRVFCSKCSFPPPPFSVNTRFSLFCVHWHDYFFFFFFYNNNCPPPHTQLLPIILKLVKTLNNK